VTEHISVKVDARLCEGHGICTELAPDVFDLADDDIVTATDANPAPAHQAAVRAAAAACPRQAITVI
jgi:ferredoxin